MTIALFSRTVYIEDLRENGAAPLSRPFIGGEWRCLRVAAVEHNEKRIVNFWVGVSYPTLARSESGNMRLRGR